MKAVFPLSLFFILWFVFPTIAFAQVVINEFSSGTTSDWVELYNTATESADLSTFRLRDSTASNKKDLSGSLVAGGFLSFPFSNYLNKDGDVVKLIELVGGDEVIVEEIAYGDTGGVCAPSTTESIGRYPNGSSTIVRFSSQTRDFSNDSAAQNPCPTLTPSPTPTPSLTPTQSPTPSTPAPTSTKTPSPTPTKTPKPTKTPSPKPIPTSTSTSEPFVFGLKDENSPSPTEEATAGGKVGGWVKNIPFRPIVFIIIGAGLLIGTGVTFVRGRKLGIRASESEEEKIIQADELS